MTLILSNDDAETALTMPDCIDVLEDAYRELAHGRGVSRTRSDSFCPTTRPDALYSLKSMDGIVPKLGVGAVRINSDIVTWPVEAGTERRVKVPSAPNARRAIPPWQSRCRGKLQFVSCLTPQLLRTRPGFAVYFRAGRSEVASLETPDRLYASRSCRDSRSL